MIKYLVIFLLSVNSFAKSNPFFEKIPCSNKVFQAVSSLGTPKKWLKKENVVSSSLEEGGSISLEVEKDKSYLSYGLNKSRTKFEYQSPKCKVKVVSISRDKSGFDDVALENLFEKNESGVIYIWSPHMSLSVYEMVEMQDYLKKIKVPVTILLDLNAAEDLTKSTIEKYDLSPEYALKMNSRSLEKFGANIHFPSTVFYKKGKIIKRIPGYNGEKELNNLIKKYLGK
jgi:hypothetical protein